MKIISNKKISNVSEQVYDFTVKDVHHYILDNNVISHNSYVPMKEMSGGSGLKYTASTILFLSKKKDKDGTEVVGNIIRVRAVKSRFTRQDKVVEVKLSYTHGLDRYYGLLPIAEKYGIFPKVGKKYEVAPGVTVFENKILKNPEKYYTAEVMEKLEKACAAEFKYGPGEFMADQEESDDDDSED